MGGTRRITVGVVLALGLGALAPPSGALQADAVREPFTGVVPRPEACVGEDDNPEQPYPLQLQGQVPWAHRVSGLAAEGYRCNLELVANIDGAADDFGDAGFANLDTFGECAFYSLSNTSEVGTAVVDVSDPSNPVRTDLLTSPSIGAPWESLRANNRRGLLAGAANGSPILDVYDVATDCRRPELLSSTEMPDGVGHEGWFSPDGTTYYMTPIGAATAVDLRDPTTPRQLGTWGQSHGGSTSFDGTRAYFCQTSPNAVTTWDTSAIARGEAVEGEPERISEFLVPDSSACQQTYPLVYDGRPYVLQMGEIGPNLVPDCTRTDGLATFAPPVLIDMADERNPVLAARLMNEVSDPTNCELVVGDRSAPAGTENDNTFAYALFQYGTHMCTPDRLIDPTILACAEFLSGIRVYDVRDPYAPSEIAYFNWGTLAPGVPTVEMHAARPVIRPDEGEIWMVGAYTGFSVLRFADGVYPFPETLQCAAQYDYHFDQYSDACPASMYGEETAEDDGDAPADGGVQVDRIAGDGPTATAVAVSQDSAASGGAVVIARDDVYADSLAGGPLATRLDAPLLLSDRDALSPVTRTEVERLGAERAVLLGGTAALSPAVEQELDSMGVAVDRVGGVNRFATAARIAAEVGTATGEVLVVEGEHADPARGWPDAMAASALAAYRADPIVLVNRDRLPQETVDAITASGAERAAIVGGDAAVSPAVAEDLAARTGAEVRRIDGATRYATSEAVVAASVDAGMDASTLWFATGTDWRDALVAGPAAARAGQPLALLDGHGGDDRTAQILQTYADGLRRVRLVGDADSISAATEQRVRELVSPPATQPPADGARLDRAPPWHRHRPPVPP